MILIPSQCSSFEGDRLRYEKIFTFSLFRPRPPSKTTTSFYTATRRMSKEFVAFFRVFHPLLGMKMANYFVVTCWWMCAVFFSSNYTIWNVVVSASCRCVSMTRCVFLVSLWGFILDSCQSQEATFFTQIINVAVTSCGAFVLLHIIFLFIQYGKWELPRAAAGLTCLVQLSMCVNDGVFHS